jgi:hypothetical protein
MRSASILLAGCAGVAALVAAGAAPAGPKDSNRYGIKGEFLGYDKDRQVMKVQVTSREAKNFGGSTAGEEAPDDIPVRAPMDFKVNPEGSVLSRTVIKSTQGTGLDNTGTQAGFEKAVQMIPTDRSLVLSIEKVAGATDGAPPYKIKTIFIPLTEAEIQERIRRFTEGEDGTDPAAQ